MRTRTALAAILATLSVGAHAVGRLADITIHDRATGRDLPVYWHEGRAYVVGKPGNEYQVSVRNQRGEDLLAVVSVDGVNVMSGETASPSQSGYVLGSGVRYDVKGWRKSLGEVASFYFTSLGDSYAARTDRPRDVGVIGVALFERARPVTLPRDDIAPHSRLREKNESRESSQAPEAKRADSAGARAEPPAASAPLGTGHGRREDSPVRYVDFQRATRDPAETVAIYYDSYRNLVAQGVIPTYGQRRDPQPFPSSFVPDPPRYR